MSQARTGKGYSSVCRRASSKHGIAVSCIIVPSSPRAEESELRSKREASRIPTKSSGSAGPKFAANNLAWRTDPHVARDWGGLDP
jgi:hypothetical protein